MIRARIDSMAYGGYGVARVDGLVHFVPGSAPGDLVEIEQQVRKKNHAFSRLLHIVEPSPLRTEPFCAYFGKCGGCQLQHIQYLEQIKIKQRVFVDQMRRIGGFSDISEPEMAGSEAKRLRMRFQTERGVLGLFERGSHAVCRVDRCAIASPGVNRVLMDLQHLPEHSFPRSDGSLTVLAAASGTLVSAVMDERAARSFYQHLGETVRGITAWNGRNRIVLGQPYLDITVQGLALHVPADSFWQANPDINEVLVQEICAFMKGLGKVYDLYCGCGNLSLPLSSVCHEVVGIERNANSVEAARTSASGNGMSNVSFVTADILNARIDDAQGIVLDPPRTGIPPKLIEKIDRQRPERIAYVSCNPSTLARDVRRLVNSGYKMKTLRLLDMFPHTYHIESLVFLQAE